MNMTIFVNKINRCKHKSVKSFLDLNTKIVNDLTSKE